MLRLRRATPIASAAELAQKLCVPDCVIDITALARPRRLPLRELVTDGAMWAVQRLKESAGRLATPVATWAETTNNGRCGRPPAAPPGSSRATCPLYGRLPRPLQQQHPMAATTTTGAPPDRNPHRVDTLYTAPRTDHRGVISPATCPNTVCQSYVQTLPASILLAREPTLDGSRTHAAAGHGLG